MQANTSIFREDDDNSRYKDRLEYYLWLAKLADKGKISTIFVADVYGGKINLTLMSYLAYFY